LKVEGVIKTEKEYKKALKRAEKLMLLPENSPEDKELELLSLLIEDYENKHYPIEPPDPIEAIKFRMEQQGLTQKDLAKVLGGSNRASEVLNRKRNLSLKMIRKLKAEWNMSAEILIG